MAKAVSRLGGTFTFRIPIELLRKAQRKAEKRGTFLACVVREFVYAYGNSKEKDGAQK